MGNRVISEIGQYTDLLAIVKQRKLRWYGHVTRSSGLFNTTLQGIVSVGRQRGRKKKQWEDNIREWTGLEKIDTVRKAENREEWRRLVAASSMAPQRIRRLRDQ